MNARCHICNRFMSYASMNCAVVYTPFGGPLDLEPPDDEFMHEECWTGLPEKDQRLINYIAWRADERIRVVGGGAGTDGD